MELKAKLFFDYENEREAEAVVKSVSPDNVKVPLGLSVKTARSRQCLLASVNCELSLETFIATLDDLLACISVAEKTFETVKNKAIT